MFAPCVYGQTKHDVSLCETADSLHRRAHYLYNSKLDYTSALEIESRANTIYKEYAGVQSSQYLESLLNLSIYNSELDNIDIAIVYAREVYEQRKKLLGSKSPATIEASIYLASFLIQSEEYEESSKLTQVAIKQMKKYKSGYEVFQAKTLFNAAEICAAFEDYGNAIELTNKAIQILSEIKGGNNDDYACGLQMMARFHYLSGNTTQAVTYQESVLNHRSQYLSDEHPYIINGYINLRNLYINSEHFDEAETIQKNILSLLNNIKIIDPQRYLEELYQLCDIYELCQKHDKLMSTIDSTASFISTSGLFSEKEQIDNLGFLASYCHETKEYNYAVKFGEKTLDKIKVIDGKSTNYLDAAVCLIEYYKSNGQSRKCIDLLYDIEPVVKLPNIYLSEKLYSLYEKVASHYAACCKYDKAIEFQNIAIESVQNLEKKDSLTLAGLEHLAYYYSIAGDYRSALETSKEEVEGISKIYGTESPMYIRAITFLANYYSDINDFSKAIDILNKVKEWHIRNKKEETDDYANLLNNLAVAYSETNEIETAYTYLKESATLKENLFGYNSLEYETTLSNLAAFSHQMGDYKSAISLGLQALDISLSQENKSPRTPIDNLSNLAIYYSDADKPKEALKYGLKGYQLSKEILGNLHPDYTRSIAILTRLFYDVQDADSTAYYANQFVKSAKSDVIRIFPYLTIDEQRSYWSRYNTFFLNLLPACAANCKRNDIYATAYDASIFAKGLLLSANLELKRAIQDTHDEQLMRSYEQLADMQATFNNILQQPKANRQIDIDSLYSTIQEKQASIIRNVPDYGSYLNNLKIGWKDVREALKENEIAIEFVSFPVSDEYIQYGALIINHSSPYPEFVELCKENEIRNIPINHAYSDNTIYSLIWKPIEDHIKGYSDILFSASGDLHKIAIESAFIDKDLYISDLYNIHRLSSTRQIIHKSHNIISEDAVLFGGLTYDDSVEIMETHSKPCSDNNQYEIVSDVFNQLRNSYSYLPGTKKEVEDISKLLSPKYRAHTYIGNNGTESMFKSLSGGRTAIIHIATHGFYGGTIQKKLKSDIIFKRNEQIRYKDNISLSSSGLLFSGANNKLQGYKIPDGIDDGILLASESMTLDLRNVELLTLSACQTGLGEINGEGVFGLQRGFKIAGVHSILMSLWEVDDRATNLLMKEFYNGVTNGLSFQKSIEMARLYVRNYEQNGERIYSDPRYWAAFVLLD